VRWQNPKGVPTPLWTARPISAPPTSHESGVTAAALQDAITRSFVIRISAFVILLASTLTLPSLQAGSSANYTLSPEALDHGGQRGTSTNYTLNPSNMPGAHGTSAAYTLRTGFAGQLADAIATAIDITASPLTVNEGSTRQLSATLIFDDLSSQPLAATSITWSVQSGPLASISTSGLATAAAVYQDTAAIAQGTYQSLTDTVTLTILNTQPDNFGTYAADAINDIWQVQYFGLPPNANAAPSADPDFDGQNNLFEFTAGIVPTNANSFFRIEASAVPGQPSQKSVIFSPRFNDRTYTVQTSLTLLAPSWLPLTTFTTSDAATVRTVTDTSATGERKFYRVDITRP
jgi:hypothetical protein